MSQRGLDLYPWNFSCTRQRYFTGWQWKTSIEPVELKLCFLKISQTFSWSPHSQEPSNNPLPKSSVPENPFLESAVKEDIYSLIFSHLDLEEKQLLLYELALDLVRFSSEYFFRITCQICHTSLIWQRLENWSNFSSLEKVNKSTNKWRKKIKQLLFKDARQFIDSP